MEIINYDLLLKNDEVREEIFKKISELRDVTIVRSATDKDSENYKMLSGIIDSSLLSLRSYINGENKKAEEAMYSFISDNATKNDLPPNALR